MEGYIAVWRKYPEDEIKIRVARPSILGPSEKLLREWKEGKIGWVEYERRFRDEILSNPEAMERLREIKRLSEEKNVRLMCYEKNPQHCHRRLLIDLINSLD